MLLSSNVSPGRHSQVSSAEFGFRVLVMYISEHRHVRLRLLDVRSVELGRNVHRLLHNPLPWLHGLSPFCCDVTSKALMSNTMSAVVLNVVATKPVYLSVYCIVLVMESVK